MSAGLCKGLSPQRQDLDADCSGGKKNTLMLTGLNLEPMFITPYFENQGICTKEGHTLKWEEEGKKDIAKKT